MDDLCGRIERAALLHDIGKLVRRAHSETKTHAACGAAFLERFFGGEGRDILRAVGHHHWSDLKDLRADADDISYIIYEADNLAAATDRRETEEGTGGFSAAANLQSVFYLFADGGAHSAKEAFHLRGLDPETYEMQMPCPSAEIRATEAAYQDLCQHLEANFQRRSPLEMTVGELLRVLEGVLSYVPSSTARAEAADISLYDHVRLTAAYAAAMYRYFEAHGITDYRCCTTGDEGRAWREKPMYLLVSGDVSGIQPFIYGIPSAGALKSLRGRSFYLEILLENVVDEILTACGISRSALLYTGGGHFYLLLPNTDAVQEILTKCRQAVNAWLLEHFGTRLYLAMAWTPCAAAEFGVTKEGGHGTQAAFRRVSELLSAEKLCRYSEDQLAALFSPSSALNKVRDASRECAICHTSTTELAQYRDGSEIEVCPMCSGLYVFGERILAGDVFAVSEDAAADALPLPGLSGTLYLTAKKLAETDDLPQTLRRIYIKNKVYTGAQLATHLWLGDYTVRKDDGGVMELGQLAARSGGTEDAAGIRRLGVLRADVDNLGAAFLAGFPAPYATLTRTASLSRQLSLFFKRYINEICCGNVGHGAEKFSLFGREKKAERDVHIVYSGGDDIFLLGAWDDIVELAVDLRRAFRRFTSGKLHFSAGIGFFKDKCPVAAMARQTGALESLAKGLRPAKDAVALFGTSLSGRSADTVEERAEVYGWDDFIDGVCGEKLAFLRENLSWNEAQDKTRVPFGKSKAYQLLTLLEDGGDDIQIARFAYVLARLAAGLHTEQKAAYERVRSQLYAWYRDKEERRQLRTALEFIIYSIREKGENADG